jgi:ATP-dependent DNA helicase RecG
LSGSSAHKQNDQNASLGRLKSLGLSEMWQVALLLPNGWDDLTRIVDRFDARMQRGEPVVLKGRLVTPLKHFFEGGTPRMTGKISDGAGREITFTVFGDFREVEKDLKENADCLHLFGQIDIYKDAYQLKNPDIVQEKWLGRLRPRYPGKPRVITPDTVRDRVGWALRDAIPVAAEHLAHQLNHFGSKSDLAKLAGLADWPLETILTQAHYPRSLEYGKRSQRALERLAALGIIKSAQGNHSTNKLDRPLRLGDWRKRAATISFKHTDEQELAVTEIMTDLARNVPMRRILSGDVGTGKTGVYLTAAAAVVDGLGTVVVLLPNASLAAQIARECEEWWPDMPYQLITGESREDICAPLVIGTTAILFRDNFIPDLVIIDEQQKMARHQREQLVGPETHLLEVTATCIPRTQALIRYGVVNVSRLSKNHTLKTIYTRIWQAREGMELFREASKTLEAGDRILLVYPLREKAEVADENEKETPAAKKKPDLRSAEEVFQKWCQMFPGKVRWIHGQMSNDEKKTSLDDMSSGAASVLVATTVVEVGITIPKLRRCIVVHCERHGLTTLHQLRGRLARHGGEGWFDLYLPNKVKDETMARLQVLVETTDGFKVAEHDMRLRGVGDMSKDSTRQSGADETFLFGRPVSIDALDEMMENLPI